MVHDHGRMLYAPFMAHATVYTLQTMKRSIRISGVTNEHKSFGVAH